MSSTEDDRPTARRSPLLTALIVILVLEALAVTGTALYLVAQLVTGAASDIGGGIAITAIGVLASVWLIAIVIGALRGRAWIRGAAVTWQLVQIAVAVGCFQGIFAQPDLGWALLLPALAALALLISPALSTRDPRA
ncbi:hypothetical protein ACFSBZ_14455 [Amnibacterium flavum]|uniref:Uncharacterized protein n=1 Tax=Amnibacterium flavum TaxID=2173173 RepID=A0A2V1HTM3_9MICO|nr:hypothetical protein [Amnibacterium flavum]PVZ95945.1 hypothetical protein DDQ50_05655 [Amnibacterium flavum]